MKPITCKYCGEVITNKTEVEYSKFITEFFCDPDHAKFYYFEYMQSGIFEFDKYNLEQAEVYFENGRLYHKD